MIIKLILYLSFSLFLLMASCLAYINPLFNREVLAASQQWPLNIKEWKWDYSFDVQLDDEKYPLVILRTGFKAIKISKDNALVGWKMYIANTSKTHQYAPEVEYFITDSDGFYVASSTNRETLWPMSPESFRQVQGTITIPISDLERVVSVTWSILISGWVLIERRETNESTSKGKRYERLAALVADETKRPYWLRSVIEENRGITYFSAKRAVINSIIFPATEEFENEKEVNKADKSAP